MTIFEFFKKQLDEAIINMNKGFGFQISPEIKVGTYKWTKVCADYIFGGAYDYELKGVTDINEMKEKKLIKINEYSNWKARMLGQTKYISLTIQGIKEFHKTMIKN